MILLTRVGLVRPQREDELEDARPVPRVCGDILVVATRRRKRENLDGGETDKSSKPPQLFYLVLRPWFQSPMPPMQC
jgi:hypothetical protein